MTGTQRVWLLNLAIAGAAVVVYYLWVLSAQPLVSPLHLPWWALAVLFAAAEVYVVHVQFRRDAHSLSLSEIPIVLGLFFSSPEELVFAQLLGAALALSLARRQSPIKLAFNIAHFSLEAGLAATIFHVIVRGHDVLGPAGWIGTFAATLTATIVGVLMIIAAISLSEGRPDLRALPQALLFGTAVTITNTGLALIGALVVWRDPTAAWLLLLPCAILFLTYRLYTSEREKHDSLESLYASSRVMQRSLKVEATMDSLLSQTRDMFRAEVADITFFPTQETDPPLRSSLGPGENMSLMQPVALNPNSGLWARVTNEASPMLVARDTNDMQLKEQLAAEGLRDLMVAPLMADEEAMGFIRVANRMGDVSTFDGEDLKLFETLATHASTSIQNARLVSHLEDSLEHLKETNRMKDDFVAAVSHELRTPLTSIQGYVKTLLRPDVTWPAEQQLDFLEAVDRQSDRLRNLIEDLLAVSRLESSHDKPILTAVELPKMVEQILDELRERSQNHVMDVRFEEPLPILQTDAGKVHQVISNLVDNALKYTPGETSITITAHRDEDEVVVSVRDQGSGIPTEVQEKVFDRFYQVDQSSTRAVGGTGLGLYICTKLAQAVGGRVWLESSDETGSCFRLSIPIRPPLDLIDRDAALAATPIRRDRGKIAVDF
ncbi:MAG: ATP-binding protein [Actinomycetota bacterium]|nr:ATP-binding protein [Actinomycetota bacterium]